MLAPCVSGNSGVVHNGPRGAEPSLVPDTPSTVPHYFCTWNVQGFACSYTNASDQADMMIEASLFGTGPNQNWLGLHPHSRMAMPTSL